MVKRTLLFNKSKFHNEKGYSLFIVVSMVGVLSFFILGILNVVRVRYGDSIRFGNKIKAIYLAEAGIEKAKYLLMKDSVLTVPKAFSEKLGRGTFDVKVARYGGYLKVESKGRAGKSEAAITALLGEKMLPRFSSAIQLNKLNNDLVAAGQNVIKGDVCLINGKLFPARISGLTFTGTDILSGDLRQKDRPDTLNDRELKNEIKALRESLVDAKGQDEIIHASLFLDDDDPARYRNRKTMVEGDLRISASCRVSGPLRFTVERSVYIEGHSGVFDCEIICGGKINMTGNAKAENVFVYARDGAYFTDSATFAGQLFCEDSIKLEGKASTLYPTLAYCLPKVRDFRLWGGIFMSSTSNSAGCFVVSLPDTLGKKVMLPSDQRFVSISENTTISGLVFNSFTTEYRGKIKGHITTGAFFLNAGRKSYMNFLLNTTTSACTPGDKTVLPCIFTTKPQWGVIQMDE